MISGGPWERNQPPAAAAKPEAGDDSEPAPRHGRDRPRDSSEAASLQSLQLIVLPTMPFKLKSSRPTRWKLPA